MESANHDHVDPLSNLSLEDSDELLAIRKISKYFPDSPPDRGTYSCHSFDVVVNPKQKYSKWTVNIEHGTLKDLKDYIREMYKPPALENDGAVLNFINDKDRYYPRNDVAFREMLRSLVSKTISSLPNDPNPSIDVYPIFHCDCVDMKNDKYKEALRKLFDELETRVATTPSMYPMKLQKASIPILISPLRLIHLKIVPEKLVEGRMGRGILIQPGGSLV
ncbi:hypothetical protein RhiirB3_443917 [Rhizophagus irregularis]|nr:hypothetical protein RhiirB3_443917 [Rhizophagus irregularis]